MGLLTNKHKQETSTPAEKCEDLVKLSTVPSSEVLAIMNQVNSIIDELDAIGQPIDELEIVSEVLEQNGYEFLNSKQAKLVEKTLKINKGGREIILTDEPITKLNLDVKLGGAVLDLRSFDFAGGDLLLNINARFSGVEVYVNQDVAIHDWIENKYSGVDYVYDEINYSSTSSLPNFDTKHTVTLEGTVKASGITFRIAHEGPYVNGMSHHGQAMQARTSQQIDEHLTRKLELIDARAEKKRINLKNKMERKKARLARKGK